MTVPVSGMTLFTRSTDHFLSLLDLPYNKTTINNVDPAIITNILKLEFTLLSKVGMKYILVDQGYKLSSELFHYRDEVDLDMVDTGEYDGERFIFPSYVIEKDLRRHSSVFIQPIHELAHWQISNEHCRSRINYGHGNTYDDGFNESYKSIRESVFEEIVAGVLGYWYLYNDLKAPFELIHNYNSFYPTYMTQTNYTTKKVLKYLIDEGYIRLHDEGAESTFKLRKEEEIPDDFETIED